VLKIVNHQSKHKKKIDSGQFIDSGNIGHTRHRTMRNKTITQKAKKNESTNLTKNGRGGEGAEPKCSQRVNNLCISRHPLWYLNQVGVKCCQLWGEKKIYVKGRRSTAILEMDNSQRLVSSVRDEIRSKTSTLKFFFVVNS
jgi:hypothetical protein